jgi:hypothetical protein
VLLIATTTGRRTATTILVSAWPAAHQKLDGFAEQMPVLSRKRAKTTVFGLFAAAVLVALGWRRFCCAFSFDHSGGDQGITAGASQVAPYSYRAKATEAGRLAESEEVK